MISAKYYFIFVCKSKNRKAMSKEKTNKDKMVKKAPAKSLKEKRAEKEAKKKDKISRD